MSTNSLLFIIAALFVVLIFILLGITWILLKNRSSHKHGESFQKVDFLQEGVPHEKKCSNHADKFAQGVCAICDQNLCEHCLSQVNKTIFCADHFHTFKNNRWTSITNQKTTADTPISAQYIYDFKKYIWNCENHPCFISCEYKINLESDIIETYVILYVIGDDQEELTGKLMAFKSGSPRNDERRHSLTSHQN